MYGRWRVTLGLIARRGGSEMTRNTAEWASPVPDLPHQPGQEVERLAVALRPAIAGVDPHVVAIRAAGGERRAGCDAQAMRRRTSPPS